MRVLVDAGSSGSGGYLRYLRGILGPGQVPDGVDVLALCSPELAQLLGPTDARVQVLSEPALSAPSRSRRVLWWMTKYPDTVRKSRPHLVLHPSGIRRGRSKRVPTVCIHHVMAPFVRRHIAMYGWSRTALWLLVMRARLSWSFFRADGVVFHCQYTRQSVRRLVPGIRRTVLVPNGLPTDFLDDAVPRADLSDPVRILCVSTLWLFKHQWNVVDAVAALRRSLGLPLEVRFIGGGEPRAHARLTARIAELDAGSWAQLQEISDLDSMADVYREADIFVFPSADETWAITLLEAMAAALPIACSDRMALPEVLGDAGVYFDPEDPVSIQRALRPLLTDKDLRIRLGTAARNRSRHFTWARSARELYSFLHTMARDHGHAA